MRIAALLCLVGLLFGCANIKSTSSLLDSSIPTGSRSDRDTLDSSQESKRDVDRARESATLANNRIDMDGDRDSLKLHDAGNEGAEPGISGRITIQGQGLDAVEVCCAYDIQSGLLGEAISVQTDQTGRYRFFREDDLHECEITPRRFGYEFEPESLFYREEEVHSGVIQADFVAREIPIEPHATGSWQLVSYECEEDARLKELSEARPDIYDSVRGLLCLTPTKEVYTFEKGCLFEERSINCVVGKEYSGGDGSCTGYVETYHIGATNYATTTSSNEYFDEETQRWHFAHTKTMFVTGNPVCSADTELVLERVEE